MAKSRVVGLDIGTTAVRAAEVQRQGRNGRFALVNYAELALPPGCITDGEVVAAPTVSATIKQLWKEGGFSTKDVAMGMGSSRTAVREIDVPLMSLANIRQSLPFQVQDTLPMPVDEAILDFVPGTQFDGTAGTMVRGLLVGAAKSAVSANVDAAENGGLRPQVVDLNALALLRAARVSQRADAVVATVDIGASMTTLAIASHGVPRMVRVIPSGGQDVTVAISRRLKSSLTEAEILKRQISASAQEQDGWAPAIEAMNEVIRTLVESIRNTFVYHHSNNPGTTTDLVVLTGGGALLRGLGQALSNASRIAVVYGDPLEGMTVSAKAQRHVSSPVTTALAVGLAQAVAS